MYNFSYMNIDSFVFKEVSYQNQHNNCFPKGVEHHYIMYLVDGSAKIKSNSAELELKQGDFCYIPRKTKYDIVLSGTPDIRFYSFGFLNYPYAENRRYNLQLVKKNEKINELFAKIVASSENECFVLGCFYLLLDEVFQTLKYDISFKYKQDIVTKAMNYISSNFNCNNADVARFCGISEAGLYNIFKATANTTPAKFAMKAKLERAVNYLLYTDLAIEEISDICGFSSTSYFRKNFYKAYKMTPREMRKSGVNNPADL